MGSSTSRAESPPKPLVGPPTFATSAGWVTATTGPALLSSTLPQAWAVRPGSDFPRVLNLFVGLRSLSRDGVVIWAMTAGGGGPTHVFKTSRWPLRLSSFRVDDGWEGQP